MKTLEDDRYHRVIAAMWHCLTVEYERDPSPSTVAIVERFRQPRPSLEIDWLKVCDLEKAAETLAEMITTAHELHGTKEIPPHLRQAPGF